MKKCYLSCYRLLFLLTILSFVWGSVFAERVPVETARRVALSAIEQLNPVTKSDISLDLIYKAVPLGISTKSSDEVDFFIFNVSGENGFVVVSGEDRVRPVLGYSSEGTFKVEGMPLVISDWLKGYQEEISLAVKQGAPSSAAIQKEWQNYLNGVPQTRAGEVKLETANWGQNAPFNNKCPVIGGKNAVTGCVATAMGIIMKYHKWPDKAEGGVTKYKGLPVSYETYNWDKMLMDYSGSYTAEQVDAVAELMWNIGANVKMEYGTEGSSSSTVEGAVAFAKVFKYSKKTAYYLKNDYSDSKWIEMLKTELDAGRPVIYDGVSEKGGHAFICDGYNGDSFRFNWGWGGYNNGFFLLSALDPEGIGSPFSSDQGGIFISRSESGDNYVRKLSLYESLKSAIPKVGESFPVAVSFFNSGNISISYGEFAIGVVDVSDYSVSKIVSPVKSYTDLPIMHGLMDVHLNVSMDKSLGTNEYLMLVGKMEGETSWTPLYSSEHKDRIGMGGPQKADDEPLSPPQKVYNVSSDLTNITADLPKEISKDATLKFTLKAAEGYQLPATISITMGGTELSASKYSYDSASGKVSVPNVTGDIVIKAVGEANKFSVTKSYEHIIGKVPSAIAYGETLNVMITAEEGYQLPATISITMGGTELSAGKYSYDSASGKVSVPNVTGDIIIKAVGEANKFSVTKSYEHIIGKVPSSIAYGETLNVTITAEEDYQLPATISITMGGTELSAGKYSYDSASGKVSVPNVTGDIVIKAVAEKVNLIFTITKEITNLTLTSSSFEVLEGESFTGVFKPFDEFKLPLEIVVEMNGVVLSETAYTYNSVTGEIIIPDISGNIIIKAEAESSAVANAVITEEEIHYTVFDGKVRIMTVREVDVAIYSFSGKCIYNGCISGYREIPLEQGVYVLILANKRYKIVL